MEAIPRQIEMQDWITFLFVGILGLVAFVKILDPKVFLNFLKIPASRSYFIESRKSENTIGGFGFLLFLSQDLLLSLGLYLLILHVEPSFNASFILFLQIFIALTVFFISKYFVEKIIGLLFSMEKFLGQYIFYKITYKNLLGLSLFPILLILRYFWDAPATFYRIGLGVFMLLNMVFLFYYYRIIRQQIKANLFYFILYLCTLEIAPYFIVYKVVT